MLFERFDPTEELSWYSKKNTRGYLLDFLYFFVGKNNLATEQKFDAQYLSDLKQKWSIQKEITSSKIEQYHNLWYFPGLIKDKYLLLSQKYNFATNLLKWNHYDHQVFLASNQTKLPDLTASFYYVKKSLGFAGQGNNLVAKDELPNFLHSSSSLCVVEEYLQRECDFAITYLDNQQLIIYENLVSPKGQYLGTVIDKSHCHSIENFLLTKKVSPQRIDQFLERLDKLFRFYSSEFETLPFQGSFDFFLYRKNNELLIHPGCEFNPRWSMGRVAWNINQNYYSQAKVFKAEFSKVKKDGHDQLAPVDSKIFYQVSTEAD